MKTKTFDGCETYKAFSVTEQEPVETVPQQLTYFGLVQSANFMGTRLMIVPKSPLIKMTDLPETKIHVQPEEKKMEPLKSMSTIERTASSIVVAVYKRGHRIYHVREIVTSLGEKIILSERPSDVRQIRLWAKQARTGYS